MNQQSSHQSKHTGPTQSGVPSQPSASGQPVHQVVVLSTFAIVRRRLRRGLAGVLFWLFVGCAAAALMDGVMDQYEGLPLLDWLEGSRLRWFFSVWIPGIAASIALVVASERIGWVEDGIEKLEAWVILNQSGLWAAMLCIGLTTIAIFIANSLASQPKLVPTPTVTSTSVVSVLTSTPTPTSTITPTATTTTETPGITGTSTLVPTLTPLPPITPQDSLIVLCASNAQQYNPVGNSNIDIPPEAYQSLRRYQSQPSLRSLIAKLYPETVYPINYPDCSNDEQIVSTKRMTPVAGDTSGEKVVLFTNPPESRIPIASVWVIMAASQSAGFDSNNREIGQIQARFLGKTSAVQLAALELGKNSADWQFRGEPSGPTQEQATITDFNLRSGDAVQTMRLLADYEVDASENRISRAAQLLAVPAAIPSAAALGQLQSVSIKDAPGGPSLDILAVVLVPADLREPETRAVKQSDPLCFQQVASDSQNVAKRDFRQDVADESPYNITPGCDRNHPTTLYDLDPDVDFFFDKTLATQLDELQSPNTNPSEIVLNVTNTISATHVYLIMSARNLCVAPASTIGTISIKETGNIYDLIAGDNIRQGRTNLSHANCDSGEGVLSMREPGEQRSTGQEIVGLRGVPLRANPNSWTEYKPAELWLDLVKVEIPADRESLTIAIRDQSGSGKSTPFITLYAAALVNEPRQ